MGLGEVYPAHYPRHVTVQELARFLGLSASYVYELCANGTIQTTQDRFRRYLITEAELRRHGVPPFDPSDGAEGCGTDSPEAGDGVAAGAAPVSTAGPGAS